MMFDPKAIEDWKAHAINCTGQEAVGLIFEGRFHPLKNVAADPENEFATDPQEVLSIIGNDGKVEAILHSHLPHHPDHPSKEDLERQKDAAVPFGLSVCDGENCTNPIWFGDQVPMRPLLGRSFVYGVWDCFSLVRDYHRMQGVFFEDFPRENWWWNEEGKDYYVESLEKNGFRIIDRAEVRAGDGFLMSVQSKTGVCNHAGIYLGNDLMLHHLIHRQSSRDIMGRWATKVRYWVRHKDMPEEVADVA